MIQRKVKREALERLRRKYDSRDYVHPDPVEMLYPYQDSADREIVGLIASCLAYGRVGQILKSAESLLDIMGSPRRFVEESTCSQMHHLLRGFKHRFTRADQIVDLLCRVRAVLKEYGSLCECFVSGMSSQDDSLVPALTAFATKLGDSSAQGFSLVPSPLDGSACKRLNLYLRWMVRKDNVDMGDWANAVPQSRLIIPLDTHMHWICRNLGLTDRKQADFRAAIEVTEGFRHFDAEDPVRYDFALSRLGIRERIKPQALWSVLAEQSEVSA